MTERQLEIIKISIEFIKEYGLNNLTMRKIADKMNFSEPAIYRHFKDKQTLILSVINVIKEDMHHITSSIDKKLKPELFFKNLLCSIMKYLKKMEGITILIMSESSYKDDKIIKKSMYDFYLGMLGFLTNYIKTQIKLGTISNLVDAEVAANMYFGIIQSMVLRYHLSDKTISIDTKCEEIIKIYLKGVLA